MSRPIIKKCHREAVAAARSEAALHGAEIIMDWQGRHPKLIVVRAGISRKMPMASSPRTDNQTDWVRQNVRRMIGSMEA